MAFTYVGGSCPSPLLESEPVFVNVYGAQESIPRNRFRQAGNRFLGSLKGLQIRALGCRRLPYRCHMGIIYPHPRNAAVSLLSSLMATFTTDDSQMSNLCLVFSCELPLGRSASMCAVSAWPPASASGCPPSCSSSSTAPSPDVI
jgi:hypothetical protein